LEIENMAVKTKIPENAISEAAELAELTRALGHEHRVAIVRFLLGKGACICGDIVEELPVAQSTVSQHLKKLKDANWITGEIEGPRTCYCINPRTVQRFFELALQTFPEHKHSIQETIMKIREDIRPTVRERYGKTAQAGGSCGSSGCCCGGTDNQAIALQIGYSAEDLKVIPDGANLGLGCGNPLEHAEVKAGETVLDLGSGAGMDCFLAAKQVGEKGRVIGVDMTPEMIERARENAEKVGTTNVEFRLGEIEHLPVADNSVDVIISNCVINLSPDKSQVFKEALRVLKPGGRLTVSDLVLRRPISEQLRSSVEAYVGCVAGAMQKDAFLQAMRDAGFAEVSILQEHGYDVSVGNLSSELEAEALAAVVSVKVKAIKKS
jgi:arsenite methyltransferase